MEEEQDINSDFKASAGDYVHTAVKGTIATIPLIGAPASEFFSLVIAPPLEKRRDMWLIEIHQRLQQLEETIEGFRVEKLSENERFTSSLLYATSVAMRTHQIEKLTALRNAVINSSLNISLDENLELIFLNFVDRYTPWHLLILYYFNDPIKYAAQNGIEYPNWIHGGASTALEYALPEMKGKESIYKQVVKDLASDGLLSAGDFLNVIMTANGMLASRTTNLGKQFLMYVSEPQELLKI